MTPAADWCRRCVSLRMERELRSTERGPVCINENACEYRRIKREARFQSKAT